MMITAIKDIIKKDMPLYYRKLYTGVSVIKLDMDEPANYRIDFTIEYKATGEKDISVIFIDTVDYPLISLDKEIIKIIDELDIAGELPD